MQHIYISGALSVDIFLPVVTVEGWSIWFLLCDEDGEPSRVFEDRFKEHQKVSSPIFDHTNTTGHNITIDNFSIVGREDQNPQQSNKRSIVYKGQQSIPE